MRRHLPEQAIDTDRAAAEDIICKTAIDAATTEIRDILDGLAAMLKGHRVRITSDYNGQPFGRSRPSLKGQEFEIDYISVSSWQKATIHIHLKDERCSVFPVEVEFL